MSLSSNLRHFAAVSIPPAWTRAVRDQLNQAADRLDELEYWSQLARDYVPDHVGDLYPDRDGTS